MHAHACSHMPGFGDEVRTHCHGSMLANVAAHMMVSLFYSGDEVSMC